MLSIRVAEVDVIRIGLEVWRYYLIGNSSLEYNASKISATSSS